MKLTPSFFAAIAACSCATSTNTVDPNAQPAVTETCAFRADGSTVDKVNASDGTASMNGSTLGITCSNVSGSTTSVIFTASIRAFDGPGEYVLDSAKTRGEMIYRGNDGVSYGISELNAVNPKCTFTFTEGPKDPKAGDVVTASFTCERLSGFKPGDTLVAANVKSVDVTDGALKLIIVR